MKKASFVRGEKTMSKTVLGLIASSSLSTAFWCAPAWAQASAPAVQGAVAGAVAADDEVGGEIIVTAQKRAQRLLDVPSAVSVVTPALLRDSGAKDLVDVSQLTPGVIVSPVGVGGRTMQTFTIRGIGNDDFRPNGNPSAAVHVDGVYQSSSALVGGQIFDVERVEVLKGPQGTLYGRNTTAGAVNIISRKPGDRFEGNISAEYGRFKSFRVEAGLGGPLSDTVGVRVSGVYDRSDGYYTNLGSGTAAGFRLNPAIPGNPDPGVNDKAARSRFFAGRAVLAYDSDQGTAITANLHGFRERGGAAQFERIFAIGAFPANRPYTFDVSFDPYLRKSSYGGSLTLQQDLSDDIFLTGIAGYEYMKQSFATQSDASPLRGAQDFLYRDRLNQKSLEVRMQNRNSDTLDWTIGASGFRDKIKLISTLDFSDSLRTRFGTDYRQSREGWAAFADGTYHLGDKWKVGVGIRYTKESSDFDGTTVDLNPYGVTANAFPSLPLTFAKDYSGSNVSGRATLSYQPNSSTNIYLSFGRGFKAGGFDGSTSINDVEANPFGDEKVWAYEGGVKFLPRGGIVQVEASAFYYDYSGLQANSVRISNGLANAVRVNVGKARIYGAELTATVRPVDRLEMQLSGAFLSSKITRIISDSPAEAARRLGNKLPFAAPATLSGTIRYSIPLSNDLELVPYVSGRYITDHYSEIDNYLQVQGYFLANAQLELRRKDSWSVAAWVRNLTDRSYTATYLIPSLATASRLRGEPRTYGVRLGFEW